MKNVVSDFGDHQVDWVRSIIKYYDKTRFDYRSLWGNRSNLAFHYGYYDEQNRHHRSAVVNTNHTLATLAGVEAGHTVLDAGCGLGGSSFWLAEQRDASAVGVNLVPSQVKYANKEARRRGLSDRASFHIADYTSTPFDDGRFDVVWALESLCHCARKSRFYAEAFRLLRPGGRLVIAEYMLTEDALNSEEQALVDNWLQGWSIPSLDTAGKHEANAHGSGFSAVDVHDWTAKMRRSSLRLYCMAVICRRLSVSLNKAGLRGDVAHGNMLSAQYQYEALRQGLWRYRILVARKPT